MRMAIRAGHDRSRAFIRLAFDRLLQRSVFDYRRSGWHDSLRRDWHGQSTHARDRTLEGEASSSSAMMRFGHRNAELSPVQSVVSLPFRLQQRETLALSHQVLHLDPVRASMSVHRHSAFANCPRCSRYKARNLEETCDSMLPTLSTSARSARSAREFAPTTRGRFGQCGVGFSFFPTHSFSREFYFTSADETDRYNVLSPLGARGTLEIQGYQRPADRVPTGSTGSSVKAKTPKRASASAPAR